MDLRGFAIVAAAAFVLAVGCTSSSTSSSIAAPPLPVPINNFTPQSPADAFRGVYDILDVASTRTGPPGTTYTQMWLTIDYSQPVVLPYPGASSLGLPVLYAGIVGLDTDGNPADGASFGFCGPQKYDFLIDMVTSGPRLADGSWNIVNASGTKTGEATPIAGGNTLTLLIPVAAIGNNQMGAYGLVIVSGDGLSPTDCAPDTFGGYVTAGVSLKPLAVKPALPLRSTWR